MAKLSVIHCKIYPADEVLCSGYQGGKEKRAVARDAEEDGRRLRHRLLPLQVEQHGHEVCHLYSNL